MMSIHDIPGFFTLEETQVDLAPDQTQALVASVLEAFSEWLETPIPKELPTTARTLGNWMADDLRTTPVASSGHPAKLVVPDEP